MKLLTSNPAQVNSTNEMATSAVVSADLRLADPRRVTLASIVQAKHKPLRTLDAATYSFSLEAQTRIVEMAEPAVRQPGIKVADTAALLGAIGSQRLFQNVGA